MDLGRTPSNITKYPKGWMAQLLLLLLLPDALGVGLSHGGSELPLVSDLEWSRVWN